MLCIFLLHIMYVHDILYVQDAKRNKRKDRHQREPAANYDQIEPRID